MKAGVAAHMALMKKLSANAGQLTGNVVFVAMLMRRATPAACLRQWMSWHSSQKATAWIT